jgi:hypothetical protein
MPVRVRVHFKVSEHVCVYFDDMHVDAFLE